VAVCGAPASGKTTLTQEVGRRLNDDQHIPTTVVPMDGYHFYKHELDAMPDPEAMHARRGAPWTFNVRVFLVFTTWCHRGWVAMLLFMTATVAVATKLLRVVFSVRRRLT